MFTNASLFLALRYLQPKRSFVSIITMISVFGIMLGVGVLIVVISVMKGFEIEFRKLLIGFEPHVLLMQSAPPPLAEGEKPEDYPESSKWQDMLQKVQTLEGVVSATPYVAGMSFVKTKEDPAPIEVYAMRAKGSEAMVEKLSKHFVPQREGEAVSSFDLEIDSIVISDGLASQLGLGIGDTVEIYSPSNLKAAVANAEKASDKKLTEEERKKMDEDTRVLVTPLPVVVTGILKGDDTNHRAFIPLHVGQELFEMGGRVNGIGVEIQDPESARAFAISMVEADLLPFDWAASTWMDRHHQRLSAVQNERVMMYFVLFFVVLVAAFSVMNTTITVTVQKRREIGILTSLGARVNQIIGIFMTQAAVVAVLGTLLGYLGGKTVLYFRNDLRRFLAEQLNVDIFPADIYALSSIPSHTVPLDIGIICITSIVLCLIGAFIPAFFAARVDPAVALRD
jgi:lipoprotein-releasing system permease protein